MSRIEIYTDISKNNDCDLGFAFTIISEKGIEAFYSKIEFASNSTGVCEAYAIVEALHFLTENLEYYQPQMVHILCDNSEAIAGLRNCYNPSKKFKKSGKKTFKFWQAKYTFCHELFEKIKSLGMRIEFIHIEGHQKNKSKRAFFNNLCDKLSRIARKENPEALHWTWVKSNWGSVRRKSEVPLEETKIDIFKLNERGYPTYNNLPYYDSLCN